MLLMDRSLRFRFYTKLLHDLAECTMCYVEQTNEYWEDCYHDEVLSGLHDTIYSLSYHRPLDKIRYDTNRTDFHIHKLISNIVINTSKKANMDKDLIGRIFGNYMTSLGNIIKIIFYDKCISTGFISNMLQLIIRELTEGSREFFIYSKLELLTSNWINNMDNK